MGICKLISDKVKQKKLVWANREIIVICAILFSLLILELASAAPVGPDYLNATNTSRRASAPALNASAIAGNVTELIINVTWITNSWQGYYGNVTGVIVLDNANNKSMYSWADASPAGEVYATRTSGAVSWSAINCSNSTHVAAEETALGIAGTDKDGVNETFNITQTGSFYVGNRSMSSCSYSQYLYENDAPASSNNFQEVLLYDGTNMLYTAVLNHDKLGFDNLNHDFEMLVGENGHNGDTTVTPYYFYVELG